MFCRLVVGAVLLAIAGALPLFPLTDATAASFECNPSLSELPKRAGVSLSPVEKLICDSPEASELDEKLAGLYWLARQLSPKRGQIISDHKNWIAQERNTCKTTDCMVRAQGERYRELKKEIAVRLRPLPLVSAWEHSTRWSKDPDSYCVRFGGKNKTRDVFDLFLMHDNRSVCGKGCAVVDCGRRIHDISPINGYIEDGIAWVEFDGRFGGLEQNGRWRALVAFDGKKLYWRVIHHTEAESYVKMELHLNPGTNGPSRVEMDELKRRCSEKVRQ